MTYVNSEACIELLSLPLFFFMLLAIVLGPGVYVCV